MLDITWFIFHPSDRVDNICVSSLSWQWKTRYTDLVSPKCWKETVLQLIKSLWTRYSEIQPDSLQPTTAKLIECTQKLSYKSRNQTIPTEFLNTVKLFINTCTKNSLITALKGTRLGWGSPPFKKFYMKPCIYIPGYSWLWSSPWELGWVKISYKTLPLLALPLRTG